MRYSYFYDIVYAILILIGIIILISMVRRAISYRKVKSLSCCKKNQLMNELCEPFGYEYNQRQDIFITRLDAWQRKFGYEFAFDELAVSTCMIFDCYPIYFNYKDKTWLLEFWKGQYGITAGGEIGIYHADHIVDPVDYKKTRFEAASNDELLGFGVFLKVKEKEILNYRKLHWWLGAFRVGKHIKPEKMIAVYLIKFFDFDMKEAFLKGALSSGYPTNKIRDLGGRIVEIYQTTENILKPTWCRRIRIALAEMWNGVLNWLFLSYTVPFKRSEDRILFIYFQVPFIFRIILNMKKNKKKYGKRHGLSR